MKISSRNISLKNGIQVELRSAVATDAKLLLEHLVVSHSESYQNMLNGSDFWKKLPETEEMKILSDFHDAPNKFMLSAFYDGKIIGSLGFNGFNGEFVKQHGTFGMSVQNRYSNQGLGGGLLKLALATAKEIGFHTVELTVRTNNVAGIALYEKAGFRQVGILKEKALIDGKYQDEYIYQIILKN